MEDDRWMEFVGGSRLRCMVFDLDGTLWNGVAGEEVVTPNQDMVSAARLLSSIGVACSIASWSRRETAERELERLELRRLFVFPKFGFRPKYQHIQELAKDLRLSPRHIMLVDDDPASTEEVYTFFKGATGVIPPHGLPAFCSKLLTCRSGVTQEDEQRVRFYAEDERRQAEMCEYGKRRIDFLASCMTTCSIHKATGDDRLRVQQLLERTNQLNIRDEKPSMEDVDRLFADGECRLWCVHSWDRFGQHGMSGVIVSQETRETIDLRQVAFSCRIRGTGVVQAVVALFCEYANARRLRLRMSFEPTQANRRLSLLLSMCGFRRHTGVCGTGSTVMEWPFLRNPEFRPKHVAVTGGIQGGGT